MTVAIDSTPRAMDVSVDEYGIQRATSSSFINSSIPIYMYIIIAYYLLNLWIVLRRIAQLYSNQETEEYE